MEVVGYQVAMQGRVKCGDLFTPWLAFASEIHV